MATSTKPTKPRNSAKFDNDKILAAAKRAKSLEALAKATGHEPRGAFVRRIAALTKQGRLPEGRFWAPKAKAKLATKAAKPAA